MGNQFCFGRRRSQALFDVTVAVKPRAFVTLLTETVRSDRQQRGRGSVLQVTVAQLSNSEVRNPACILRDRQGDTVTDHRAGQCGTIGGCSACTSSPLHIPSIWEVTHYDVTQLLGSGLSPSATRQTGQELLMRSHRVTHSLWYMWEQGRRWADSSGWNSHWQIGQSFPSNSGQGQ